MANWYVKSTGGSDAANGQTPGTAFATVSKACTNNASLAAGDTIHLSCGNHHQSDTPMDPSKVGTYDVGTHTVNWITVKGDYQDEQGFGMGKGWVKFSQRSIMNPPSRQIYAQVAGDYDYWRFENILFGTSWYEVVRNVAATLPMYFKNCVFLCNDAQQYSSVAMSGTRPEDATYEGAQTVFDNCLIYGGIMLTSSYSGAQYATTPDYVVKNCVFIGGGCKLWGGSNSYTWAEFTNNLIWTNNGVTNFGCYDSRWSKVTGERNATIRLGSSYDPAYLRVPGTDTYLYGRQEAGSGAVSVITEGVPMLLFPQFLDGTINQFVDVLSTGPATDFFGNSRPKDIKGGANDYDAGPIELGKGVEFLPPLGKVKGGGVPSLFRSPFFGG